MFVFGTDVATLYTALPSLMSKISHRMLNLLSQGERCHGLLEVSTFTGQNNMKNSTDNKKKYYRRQNTILSDPISNFKFF